MTKIEIIRKYDCDNSLYDEIIHLLLQILHLHLLNSSDKSYNEAEDANALGFQFAVVPDFVVRTGGTFWLEIQYLVEHGIP